VLLTNIDRCNGFAILMDFCRKNNDMIIRSALEGRQVLLWRRAFPEVSVFARPDSL
jgi:hypothetical protein